jgi:hypothetical protein
VKGTEGGGKGLGVKGTEGGGKEQKEEERDWKERKGTGGYHPLHLIFVG